MSEDYKTIMGDYETQEQLMKICFWMNTISRLVDPTPDLFALGTIDENGFFEFEIHHCLEPASEGTEVVYSIKEHENILYNIALRTSIIERLQQAMQFVKGYMLATGRKENEDVDEKS